MDSGKSITKLTPLTNSSNKSNNAPSNSVVKGLFDGFKKATGQQSRNNAHESALGKQLDPMTVENNRLIRRISNNTDTIVELLRKQVEGKKDNGLDLSKLLGLGGLAGLAGLASLGALAPELAKATSVLLKVGSVLEGLTKGAKTAIDLAKVAKETASVAKGGHGALKTAQTAKSIYDATRNTRTQTADDIAKSQQKANGKFGNALSVGMIGSRAYSGDYTGAGMETASTVLGNVSGKYAIPAKAVKAMLDVGIVGRDVYRWKTGTGSEDENNTGVKDWVKGLFSDKKSEPSQNTNSNNVGGELSNNVNSNIATNSNNTINNYYGTGQGGGLPQPQTESNGISAGSVGVLGAGALGALALARYKGVSLGGVAKGAKNLVSPTIAKPVATPKFTPVTSSAPKLASPKALTQGVQGAGKAGTGMALAKGGAKMAGKAVPFLGLGLGAMGAYDRAKNGDWMGAGLEMASGVASFVPVVGTGVALGIQGGLIARDMSNASGGNETSTGTGLATGALVGGTALAIASRGRIKADGLKDATDATGVVADTAKVVSTNVVRQSNTATNVMTNQAKTLKNYMGKTYNTMTKSSAEFFQNLAKNPQFVRNAGLVMAGVGGVALAGLKIGDVGVGQPTGYKIGTEIGKQGKVTNLKQSHQYDAMMKDIYSKNGYDQRMQAVLKAQVSAESGFDINARSHAGAFGLTQFMPATARQYGVKAGDAKSQFEGQAKYMRYLLKKFNGNTEYALMGYNWGEGNVDKWLKSGKTKPIPKETRDYVAKIMGNVYKFNPDFGVSTDGKTITGGVGGAQSRGGSTTAKSTASSAGGAIPSAVLKESGSATSKDKLATSDLINIGRTKGVRIMKGVDVQNMNAKFMQLFYAMVGEYHQKTGKVVQVNSAFRSVAYQNQLHNKNPKQATKGGSSMHNHGLAIDCNTVDIKGMISAGVLDKYGFYQSLKHMPNEQHHLEQRELTSAFRQKNGMGSTASNPSLSAGAGDIVGGAGAGAGAGVGGALGADGEAVDESPTGAFSKLMTGLLNSDTVSAIVDYGKHGEINKGADRQKIVSAITATNEGQKALKERETNLNGEAIDPNKFMTTKAYRLQPNQADYKSVIDKMATFDVRRLDPDWNDYNSVKDKMHDQTIQRYGSTGGGKKQKWWERWFGDVNWQDVLQNVAGATLKMQNGQGYNLGGDLANNPLIMGGGFGGGITNNSSVIGSNNVSSENITSGASTQLTTMNNETPIRWQDDPLLGQDISKFPPDLQAKFERARALRDLNIQSSNALAKSKITPVNSSNTSSSLGSAEAKLQALSNGNLSGIQTKPTMMGGLMEAVQGYANGGIGGALTSVANSTGLGGMLGEDMVGGIIDLASGNSSSDQKGSMVGGLLGALGHGFSSADKVIKANPNADKTGWGGFVNKSVGVLGQTLTGAEAMMDYKNNPEKAVMAGLSLGKGALSGIGGMFGIGKNKTGITSISQTASENLKPSSPNLTLKPDTFKDDVADKKVKLLNGVDQASKHNVTANVTLPPTANAQGKPVPQSQGGSTSGLSAPMVVRNPDSVIREVAVGMMKASM